MDGEVEEEEMEEVEEEGRGKLLTIEAPSRCHLSCAMLGTEPPCPTSNLLDL